MKNSRIDIRLTDEEKLIIKNKSKEAEMSVSEFIISQSINGKIIISRKNSELKAMNAWLGRICGNLHAISKYANMNSDDAYSLAILSSIARIEAEIMELKLD